MEASSERVTQMPIELSLAGPDLVKLINQVLRTEPFNGTLPDHVELDYTEQSSSVNWVEFLPSVQQNLTVYWGAIDNARQFLTYYPRASIHLKVDIQPNTEVVRRFLRTLDFEVGVFATLHPEWREIDPDYTPPTLPTMHYPYGWALTLKGAGRKRIVSPRWLEHNPAQVTDADGLLFVQFHNLDADAATSLAEAKPGHRAFSSEAEGGFIKDGYLLRHDFNGIYDENTAVLKVAVLGRQISPREMLDACALRYMAKLPDGRPLKNIAYVFLDEIEIGDALYQLWVRGLECWTIREGIEVRLDVNYAPKVSS